MGRAADCCRIRTVPVPEWVKSVVDLWNGVAKIVDGRLFRSVSRFGATWGSDITEKVIWHIVKAAPRIAGLSHWRPMTAAELRAAVP
jgi:hypothetical protein